MVEGRGSTAAAASLTERHIRLARFAYLGVIAAAVLLHGALAWATRSLGVMTADEAVYVALAQGLLDGTYREWFTVEALPHTLYPPVTSILLAIAGAIGGFTDDVMLVVPVVLSAAGVGLVVAAAWRRLGGIPATAVAGLLATNRPLLEYAGRPLSEAPALFFLALTIWALAPAHPSTRRHWVAGAAVLAACLTRSAMIPMLGAVLLWWLWRRQWRAAVILSVATLITLGGWFSWVAANRDVAASRSYAEDMPSSAADGTPGQTLFGRIGANAIGYAETLPPRVTSISRPGSADNVVILAVVAVGAGLLIVVGWPLVPLVLAAYGALLALWSWPVGRFLHPVVPLLVVAFITAVGALADWIGRRLQPAMREWIEIGGVPNATSGGLLLLPMFVLSGMQGYDGLWRAKELRGCDRDAAVPAEVCYTYGPAEHADYLRAVELILATTSTAEGVMAAKAAPVAWHLRRTSVASSVALNRPPGEQLAYLAQHGVTLILLARLGETDRHTLGPALLGVCDSLRLTFRSEHALVLALPASRMPPLTGDAITGDAITGDAITGDATVACSAVAAHLARYGS